METTIDVPGFERATVNLDGAARTVYRRGEGRAVIVMSEIPGITPEVAGFAQRVANAGFSVWMPQLFGTPMKPFSTGYALNSIAKVCISREFSVLAANESSPIVDWLRALARHAHGLCGGPGVGAVGMCLTGNFALAMMLDAPVIAPVLSQPSLPIGPGRKMKSALHASPAAVAAAHQKIEQDGATILGLRFRRDPMCPGARFSALWKEFGEAFEGIEIDPEHANPAAQKPAHSVLTRHLIDRDGEPTRAALDRTLAFLRERLGP